MHIDQASKDQLKTELNVLERAYLELQKQELSLDLTRGKPGKDQVALSNPLDGILEGHYLSANGTDVRNYGGLDGLAEAREFFGSLLGCNAEETLIGGNSSLALMYFTLEVAVHHGLRGPNSAWSRHKTNKFICPVPGYDRHFTVCEHLGIEMLTVDMLDTGPDMDAVEALLAADDSIRGMWCVPRFSNPTGCTYSDETVDRIAGLGAKAGEDFLVMWDNAYVVHTLSPSAPALASIRQCCEKHGTCDSVVQFGSTSKITFAGAGLAYLASSKNILGALKAQLAFQTIGPDKVNQLRHLRFLKDRETLESHMAKHAELIKPRFDAVLQTLDAELAGTGMGEWTHPLGGYFISFQSRPGLAAEIVGLAADIGVKLTPAGATYPYGKDPQDANIRLAPTFPSLSEVQATVKAFVVCVKLASVRQALR
ncbi:MAG: aminotransferase class I/II-fold pyridoxal phosphate-dependent enzyme [Halioglobus sp.]